MFTVYVTGPETQFAAPMTTLLGALFFALRLNAPGRKVRVWNHKAARFEC